MNQRSEVIIIGAGASGLMSASLLAPRHTVTVVEARSRTGGRIQTLSGLFSGPVEGGAEFIHGYQPMTSSLLSAANSELVPVSGKSINVYQGKTVSQQDGEAEWENFIANLEKLDQDIDIATFLDQHFKGDEFIHLREKVQGFTEGYDAADTRLASAIALREEWKEQDDDHQFRIAGGYDALIRFLQSKSEMVGGRIILSETVNEIQWRRGNVRVLTHSGKIFEGEKVIITVPLGLLKKKAIRFSPELNHHQNAFNRMGFGGVIKFLFEFNADFFQERILKPFDHSTFIFSDGAIPTWWTQLPNKLPLLTGWLGGPETYRMNRGNELIFAKAIKSMAYIFGTEAKQIQSEIRQFHIADWVSDPFCQGAYAYATVGSKKLCDFVSEPVENTLYFSGEAFYHGPSVGTVEAALISAERTAERI